MQSGQSDGIRGALLLCQACLQTIKSQADLVYLFSKVSGLLTGLADFYLVKLNNEFMVIPTLNANDLTITNPVVQSILDSLDILLNWVKVHESIFERFESKKFFGFQLFALSHQYANAFKSILGLYMPTPN